MSTRTLWENVSVIIPARNSAETLRQCLEAIKRSSYPIHEIIVVNDGSSDNTLEVARQHSARTIDLDGAFGPNFCRNKGAAAATGNILLFVDSDVVLETDTIKRMMEYFSDPSIDAIVGIYSVTHPNSNLASQYKNLWIRYSYLRSGPIIDWIFGAIAGIRRDAIWKVRGFDRAVAFQHGGEDLELGKRMADAGQKIHLKPDVEVKHLKGHSWITLLKNDFTRSQGFVRLAGDIQELTGSLRKGFVNVYPSFVLSTVISWPLLATLILGFFATPFVWVFLFLLVFYLALNFRFLHYFAKHRGVLNAVRVLWLMFLDHLACMLGSAIGFFRWLTFR